MDQVGNGPSFQIPYLIAASSSHAIARTLSLIGLSIPNVAPQTRDLHGVRIIITLSQSPRSFGGTGEGVEIMKELNDLFTDIKVGPLFCEASPPQTLLWLPLPRLSSRKESPGWTHRIIRTLPEDLSSRE